MALDAGIYSQLGRGVKSAAEYDAIAQAQQANKLQLLMQQMQYGQAQQSMQDAAALRNAAGSLTGDVDSDYNALLRISPKAAADYRRSYYDTQKVQSEAGKTAVETKGKASDYYRDVLGTAQSPEHAATIIQGLYSDPTIGPLLSTRGSMQDAIRSIPQDPGQFRPWLANAAMGIGEVAKLAKVEKLDQGNQIATQIVNPATGEVQTVGLAQRFQTPDSVASNARMAAEGAANRAVSMRGQDITRQAALQGGTVQVDGQGNMVIVPNKFTPGAPVQASPVMGVDGQQLQRGEKLKEIPAAANKSIIENQQNINRVDRALTAVKKNPEAVGPANMVPGSGLIRQYTNPEGVEARAGVADIGSMVIHDRSGAAVSASEFPRLAPFIPSPNDPPATVQKKLQNFKRVYEEETDLLRQTYSKGQGYRESPILSPGGAPSGVGALSPAEQAELDQLRKRFNK
jgi:hypothetical protein